DRRSGRSLEGDAMTANQVERGGRQRVPESLGRGLAGVRFEPGHVGPGRAKHGPHGRRYLWANAVAGDQDYRGGQGCVLPVERAVDAGPCQGGSRARTGEFPTCADPHTVMSCEDASTGVGYATGRTTGADREPLAALVHRLRLAGDWSERSTSLVSDDGDRVS